MKEKKKISVHFTIDKETNEILNNLVKTECLNKSLLIQTLINNYIEDKKGVK